MEEQRYHVIFKGELIQGFPAETVKRNFMSRFKVNEKALARFFSGKPLALKRDVGETDARRLKNAVQQAGGICYLRALPGEDRPSASPSAGKTAKTDAVSDPDSPWPKDWPFVEPGRQADETRTTSEEDLLAPPPPWPKDNPFSETPESRPPAAAAGEASRPPNVFDPSSVFFQNKRQERRQFNAAAHRHHWVATLVVTSVVGFLVIMGLYLWRQQRPVYQPPGILVPDPPFQNTLQDGAPFLFKEFTLTPMAEFRLQALVLSQKRYHEAPYLSPMDLALGWGPMSDVSVTGKIRISQSNRFYFWRVNQFIMPLKDIKTHSANMHLIPSNPAVWKHMKSVRKGHLIAIRGYLVNILGPDGWTRVTSLTRKDTGAGACEIIWVEDFEIL